ncbi:MAG: ABC transporter ATP-binding protein/permease [Burkholderiaceae bacterium]
MRHAASSPLPVEPARASTRARRTDWQTIRTLLPYLWASRWRVLLALACMVGAKLATVGVPILLKHIVDALDPGTGSAATLVAVPAGLIVLYGVLRLSTTLFTELRELVFVRVTEGAVRRIGLQVFEHLHALSLRFHLDRQTGGLTRDIERGTRGVSSLVSYTLYSILPTMIEIALVLGYLVANYDVWFAAITMAALAAYAIVTFSVTEWRTHFRRSMNELDSRANSRAIDSLLNYETVKYFGNEAFEAGRYDETMRHYERARIKTRASLSALNAAQALVISVAVAAMVWRATVGVAEGRMTLGDLVLVNGFMIQLYIPLNFLGTLYREIRQNLTDMERMFALLDENREVRDADDADDLVLPAGRSPSIEFRGVRFGYGPQREILHGIDFTIEPGTKTAVVGASGAGKSTIARLLFRFYDVTEGSIRIDGTDIRAFTQHSLRAAIGIVPQDTVLFNDTLGYNVAYGRPGADASDLARALGAAQLTAFVERLPGGLETAVGERGLKLSGGEKQRVAIARVILKDPPILILDEATSALDTHNEQAIQGALAGAARERTTLVIAHRLSTVVDAAQILVMQDGRIVERGDHESLLAAGAVYAGMWAAQQAERMEHSAAPGATS